MTEPHALKQIAALFKEINVFCLSTYPSVTHSQSLSRGSRANSKEKVMWFFEKGEGWQQQNGCGLQQSWKIHLVADVALETGDAVAQCPASNS